MQKKPLGPPPCHIEEAQAAAWPRKVRRKMSTINSAADVGVSLDGLSVDHGRFSIFGFKKKRKKRKENFS